MSLCFGASQHPATGISQSWVPAQLRAKPAAGAQSYSAEAKDVREGQRSRVVVSNQPLA